MRPKIFDATSTKKQGRYYGTWRIISKIMKYEENYTVSMLILNAKLNSKSVAGGGGQDTFA